MGVFLEEEEGFCCGYKGEAAPIIIPDAETMSGESLFACGDNAPAAMRSCAANAGLFKPAARCGLFRK